MRAWLDGLRVNRPHAQKSIWSQANIVKQLTVSAELEIDCMYGDAIDIYLQGPWARTQMVVAANNSVNPPESSDSGALQEVHSLRLAPCNCGRLRYPPSTHLEWPLYGRKFCDADGFKGSIAICHRPALTVGCQP